MTLTAVAAARGSLASFLSFGNQFRHSGYRGGGRSKRSSIFSLYEPQNHQRHLSAHQNQPRHLHRHLAIAQTKPLETTSVHDEGGISPSEEGLNEEIAKKVEYSSGEHISRPNNRVKEQSLHPQFKDNAV